MMTPATQIIAFYFEYLLQDAHPELSGTVALLPGAAAFLLRNSGTRQQRMVYPVEHQRGIISIMHVYVVSPCADPGDAADIFGSLGVSD
jgi:hypothetical protein